MQIKSTNIKPASADEISELKDKHDHSNGYRYAHKYTIDEHLHDSVIHLNVIRVRYVDKLNHEHLIYAYVGENLYDLRERYSDLIDRPFSCAGSLACSTCHMYVSKSFFSQLDDISSREEDMLEAIADVSDFSRLGCVINIDAHLDNIMLLHPKSQSSIDNAQMY